MKFYYTFGSRQIILDIPQNVYYPREDSLLLAGFLVTYLQRLQTKPKTILDVGTGSGFVAVLCGLLTDADITAADISKDAVECARKNADVNLDANKGRLTATQSDIFEHVSGEYDLITFNPPYLPADDLPGNDKKVLIECGQIERFVSGLPGHLTDGGVALLLVSSLTPIDVPALCRRRGLKAMVVKRKKLEWEELKIYIISRTNPFNSIRSNLI